jgi:hypothetical protein
MDSAAGRVGLIEAILFLADVKAISEPTSLIPATELTAFKENRALRFAQVIKNLFLFVKLIFYPFQNAQKKKITINKKIKIVKFK